MRFVQTKTQDLPNATQREKTMAKKMDTTVKLHPAQYKRLKDYEAVLGHSVDSAVYEALSDFMECCVSTRLESYQRKTHVA